MNPFAPPKEQDVRFQSIGARASGSSADLRERRFRLAGLQVRWTVTDNCPNTTVRMIYLFFSAPQLITTVSDLPASTGSPIMNFLPSPVTQYWLPKGSTCHLV